MVYIHGAAIIGWYLTLLNVRFYVCPSERSRRKPLITYHLGEELLSHSPETSDLGVSVPGNCTWNIHIEQMCAKANRIFGLVKRLCGRDIRDV